MLDRSRMLLTTAEDLRDRKIVKTIGLVKGSTIRARHLGRDIQALLRSALGGEIKEYTQLVAEAREQAVERMASEARNVGANAIVGIRFSTSMIMSGAAEILVYGTAVVVE